MAEIINLNDVSPAYPAGRKNIAWQKGASTGVDPVTGLPIYPVSGNFAPTGEVNPQTGTSYTIDTSDRGKLVTFSNSSAIAVTLPESSPSTIPSDFMCWVQNLGGGTATLSAGSPLVTVATLTSGQGATLFFDGASWEAVAGGGTSGGGGGGNNTTLGTTAAFYTAPPSGAVAGDRYVCSDSPYEYVYDGAAWKARLYGVPVTDCGALTWVQKNASNFGSPALDTSNGGVFISGSVTSGAADQVWSILQPVTPSSTLKVRFGMTFPGPIAGVVAYNANNNRLYIMRWIGGTTYFSTYSSDGASWVANPFTAAWSNGFPTVNSGPVIRFDASNIYFEYWDASLRVKLVSQSFALSAWLGTNYTHLGFGINAAQSMWAQSYDVLST